MAASRRAGCPGPGQRGGLWRGYGPGQRSTGSASCFFFQAEDGIRYPLVTGVQTCALPISRSRRNEYCAKPVLVRPGEANSYLAPRACLRPVAGGSLRPPPVLDAGGRAPPATARSSTVTTRVPAVPGRGTDRRSRGLDQSVTCRELAASGFPECAGSGPWRVDAQTWQNRTRINRQRALLTAPVPHWQAKAPRPGGNGFLDAGRAPPWPTVENPKRHATATLCRIVGPA